MPRAVPEDCPFCHHQRATLRNPGQETRSGGRRDIYRCDECGCYYPRPRMDAGEALAWLLGSDGPAGKDAPDGTADPAAPLPAMTLLWRLKRMLRPIGFPYDFRAYLPRRMAVGGRSLDIGTYDGRMCAFMEAMGYEAHGLEPQEAVARRAADRGLKVWVGSFPDAVPEELERLRFDLVSISEAIYYFADLRRALARVNALLAPGGHCLIKCHQGDSRYYAVTGSPFFKRLGDNLQAVPTRASLGYWLERSGFAVVDVSGGVWPRARADDRLPVRPARRWAGWQAGLRDRADGLFLFGRPLFDLDEADVLVVLARKQQESGMPERQAPRPASGAAA